MKSLRNLILFVISVLLSGCNFSKSSSEINTFFDEQLTPEEEWEECEYCDGDGYFILKCDACNGSGRLITTITHKETRTCPTCHGLGIAPCNSCGNYGYTRCDNCSGAGKHRCRACDGVGRRIARIAGQTIISECGMCDGTGYEDCMKCGGDGRITCSKCLGEGHLTCRTCNGTGGPDITSTQKLDQGECPVCKGSGRVAEVCDVCDGEGKIKVE